MTPQKAKIKKKNYKAKINNNNNNKIKQIAIKIMGTKSGIKKLIRD